LAAEKQRSLRNRAHRKSKINSNFGKDGYLTAVRKAKEYIRAGMFFSRHQPALLRKTNALLSKFIASFERLSFAYLFYLQLNDVAVVGSSPECWSKSRSRRFLSPDRGNALARQG